jgi:thioredoxin-like negative regulator of GroEL
MWPKITRMALLFLMLALIAATLPVCGCSSEKKTTTKDTSPSTAAQETVPQPESTVPSTQGGTSKSEAALEQAKAEGKPVLLNFHSTKCIPCIQIEENINKVKPEYEGKVAFIIVDVYDQSEYNFCMEYDIETIPTTVFIRKDGSVANGHVGVLETDQLKKELDVLL